MTKPPLPIGERRLFSLQLFQNVLQLMHTMVGGDDDHAVAELDSIVAGRDAALAAADDRGNEHGVLELERLERHVEKLALGAHDELQRLGLTVSAKLAHAVHRNRLRRQLREIYRLHEAQFARGYDIVVVARTRAIGADYAALERAYLSLAAKLGLLGGQTA